MKTILQQARVKAGMTQVQVAKACRMCDRQYQNYEYGKRAPGVYAAIRIARALDSTVEELFPLEE